MIRWENFFLLLPQTAVVSTKPTARGRSSPMCRMGPQMQGHSCWRPGSLQPPSTSALVPTLLLCQLVRPSRAVPQGSTPLNPFSFGFCICSDQLSVWGQFPAAHNCSSALLIHADFFSKSCLPISLCAVLLKNVLPLISCHSPANPHFVCPQWNYTFTGVFLSHHWRKLPRSFLF